MISHRLLPALVVFLISGLFASSATRGDDRPNMIVFIADDVSWNDYGCYGNTFARTPNIDQLAANGLKFTNAFLTASSCSPSRASIITGRYPHNNGKAAELHLPIASHLRWFPELLREAGYYTALVGKKHMRRDKPQPGQPIPGKAFDLIDNGQVKDNHGGESKWVETVANRPKDKPFFFWFAAIDAHRAWDADREWKKKYGKMHSPERVLVPPYLVDDAETRRDLASYYNEVTRFDYFIGQVVEQLRKEDQLKNTLILVLADNGRPFPRAKTRLHDSGMKTALVAHWPEGIRSRGAEASGLVSVIDLAPTLLAAAKIPAPESFQGVSLQPVFSDPGKIVRDFVFSEHNWHDYEAHGRSIRDNEGHLYIINRRPQFAWQGPADSVRSPSHQSLLKKKNAGQLSPAQQDVLLAPRKETEFFDSRKDPLQLNNRSGDEQVQNRESTLRGKLLQWIRETGDSIPEKISEDSFDRQSGDSLENEKYRFTTPGEDRNASRINHSGPIRN
ncbi:MAG: sulfatase [Planctomycetota bacterium]|nr:sulfatase [Planctomycetota bacterium]